ncbi:Serine/threonine-protein phosphatase 2A activator 1 [Recurvomyces mirabilis]|uniref:Serine/threonine-protein phosphatase 2A activator n=1 Tax=Recurvomyces mirabilis TaxID=574656 RepID=A0AAE0WLL4_9PEZI|nr:Serine/threonine-protein phosphatase 2A activator 1 [Recurvomyces mirabilis]KAK5151995.1 Serine/threonine-protein phosphatase 2A activator 1 [Recurvomyces mirabilis]
MTTSAQAPKAMRLELLPPSTAHTFTTPSKRINDGNDLSFFLSSTAYRDLTVWILQLNRSMFPISKDGKDEICSLLSPPSSSSSITSVQSILKALTNLLEKAPPSTGPRRFGNVAFRDWFNLVEQDIESLVSTHLSSIFQIYVSDDHERSNELVNELRSYLIGSFGSPQRLDYGTGHELSFLAFLGCLWKLDFFQDGEERTIVSSLIQPYLILIRRLILTYTLEPAGSHGVWGLDDHSFAPYIFGSAQLGPAIDPEDWSKPVPTEGSHHSAPSPASVTKKDVVRDYEGSNMYFSAIQFIYDVKKGPFWEHSPVLYDISGLKDGWGKINKGMLKMYAAEVLGKFPVVQHFPFGSLFKWEADPDAVAQTGSVHAQQQPVSKDVPIPPPGGSGGVGVGVGTAAPWAKSSGGSTQAFATSLMPASTGIPSTRAPWAGSAGATTSMSPPGGVRRSAATTLGRNPEIPRPLERPR